MPDAHTYLDNNATTRVDERVVSAMLPCFTEHYGNPSSGHRFGAAIAARIATARASVARLIGARDNEIIFTSGGTEADNAALRGVLAANPQRRHLVVSAVEHHAILDLAEVLRGEGVEVTVIGVDHDGRPDLDALERSVRDDTALVSVMLANNETGVVLPVRAVCEIATRRGVPVHTDAVNALGKMPIDVDDLGVSLLSLSAHKVYGPKGVGALYLRRGTAFRPWMIGGHQESDRRGGTHNAAGIVGLGVACDILRNEGDALRAQLKRLHEQVESDLARRFPESLIVGAGAQRLVNTTCVCFPDTHAEALLLRLSEQGVYLSSGAACASGAMEPSHVLRAMGVGRRFALGQIRISLGRHNHEHDLERLFALLPDAVARVRSAGLACAAGGVD
ncbi:MAG: cysteine desulfurase family protein [Phycisphaerae bacterium]